MRAPAPASSHFRDLIKDTGSIPEIAQEERYEQGIHEIDEFSIGHSIISRALMTGMRDAVEEMVRLIRAL